MPGKRIYTLPETATIDYYLVERAAVVTWLSFRTGMVPQATRDGMEVILRSDARTLIVDTTRNPGILTRKDDAAQRELSRVLAAKQQIQAFVIVLAASRASALTKLAIREQASVSLNAGHLYERASLKEALHLAHCVASGLAVPPPGTRTPVGPAPANPGARSLARPSDKPGPPEEPSSAGPDWTSVFS